MWAQTWKLKQSLTSRSEVNWNLNWPTKFGAARFQYVLPANPIIWFSYWHVVWPGFAEIPQLLILTTFQRMKHIEMVFQNDRVRSLKTHSICFQHEQKQPFYSSCTRILFFINICSEMERGLWLSLCVRTNSGLCPGLRRVKMANCEKWKLRLPS